MCDNHNTIIASTDTANSTSLLIESTDAMIVVQYAIKLFALLN